MTLQQLKYAIAVAESGSMNEAARKLFVSQPSLSSAIRELEKIEMVRQTDGVYRMDHAVTATQKAILRAFDIDAEYVRREAGKLSKILAEHERKEKREG